MRMKMCAFSVTALVVSCCCDLGCDPVCDLALDESRPDVPFLFIHQSVPTGGPEALRGIVAAVWQDGRVVRVDADAEPGSAYIEGRASDEQIAGVLTAIKARNLGCPCADEVFVDFKTYRFYLRLENGIIDRFESDPSVGRPVIAEIISLLMSLDLLGVEPTDIPGPDGGIPASWVE